MQQRIDAANCVYHRTKRVYNPRAVRLQVLQATKLTIVRQAVTYDCTVKWSVCVGARCSFISGLFATALLSLANHAASLCLIAQLRARAVLSARKDCTQSTADHCKGDSHNRHITGHDRPSTNCFDTASVVQVTGVERPSATLCFRLT